MTFLRRNLRIRLRDLTLLRELYQSRVMSLRQASQIIFDGAYPSAAKRIQKLKSASYVAELPKRIGDQSILYLTARGRRRLIGGIDPPSRQFRRHRTLTSLTLAHDLEVMDAKVAIVIALRRCKDWSVREFTTWPQLSQFRVDQMNGTHATVKPDGFLSLSNCAGIVVDFFLEIDRAHETQAILEAKCHAYRSHYLSGNFAARLGHPRSAYRSHPFRVLVVVPSDERRNNLALRLCALERPIHNQVWLTTRAALLADPLAAIWICPQDYAHAIANSRYARFGEPIAARQYRTASDRERFVAEQIRKRRLLE